MFEKLHTTYVFIRAALAAWEIARNGSGVGYIGCRAEPGEPPRVCILVAVDREAWRVTQWAIELTGAEPTLYQGPRA